MSLYSQLLPAITRLVEPLPPAESVAVDLQTDTEGLALEPSE